mmetsp:Transcript_27110/g.108575  ORF Transcript_27110/g.108575 Transcript_27110/m.108575 type:complete len:383 (+) Transcript_27110:2-1150(+)
MMMMMMMLPVVGAQTPCGVIVVRTTRRDDERSALGGGRRWCRRGGHREQQLFALQDAAPREAREEVERPDREQRPCVAEARERDVDVERRHGAHALRAQRGLRRLDVRDDALRRVVRGQRDDDGAGLEAQQLRAGRDGRVAGSFDVVVGRRVGQHVEREVGEQDDQRDGPRRGERDAHRAVPRVCGVLDLLRRRRRARRRRRRREGGPAAFGVVGRGAEFVRREPQEAEGRRPRVGDRVVQIPAQHDHHLDDERPLVRLGQHTRRERDDADGRAGRGGGDDERERREREDARQCARDAAALPLRRIFPGEHRPLAPREQPAAAGRESVELDLSHSRRDGRVEPDGPRRAHRARHELARRRQRAVVDRVQQAPRGAPQRRRGR